jgi:hypothetical protein
MMKALQGFLNQADLADDPLRRSFQQGVMAFIQGQLPQAVQQLEEVLTRAKAAGERDIAGDSCRWLGHAHGRAGEPGKAAAAFAEGCQLGREHGNKRLQVRAGTQGAAMVVKRARSFG